MEDLLFSERGAAREVLSYTWDALGMGALSAPERMLVWRLEGMRGQALEAADEEWTDEQKEQFSTSVVEAMEAASAAPPNQREAVFDRHIATAFTEVRTSVGGDDSETQASPGDGPPQQGDGATEPSEGTVFKPSVESYEDEPRPVEEPTDDTDDAEPSVSENVPATGDAQTVPIGAGNPPVGDPTGQELPPPPGSEPQDYDVRGTAELIVDSFGDRKVDVIRTDQGDFVSNPNGDPDAWIPIEGDTLPELSQDVPRLYDDNALAEIGVPKAHERVLTLGPDEDRVRIRRGEDGDVVAYLDKDGVRKTVTLDVADPDNWSDIVVATADAYGSLTSPEGTPPDDQTTAQGESDATADGDAQAPAQGEGQATVQGDVSTAAPQEGQTTAQEKTEPQLAGGFGDLLDKVGDAWDGLKDFLEPFGPSLPGQLAADRNIQVDPTNPTIYHYVDGPGDPSAQEVTGGALGEVAVRIDNNVVLSSQAYLAVPYEVGDSLKIGPGVEVGSVLKKGEEFFRFERPELEADIANAETSQSNARIGLGNAVREAQAEDDQLGARLETDRDLLVNLEETLVLDQRIVDATVARSDTLREARAERARLQYTPIATAAVDLWNLGNIRTIPDFLRSEGLSEADVDGVMAAVEELGAYTLTERTESGEKILPREPDLDFEERREALHSVASKQLRNETEDEFADAVQTLAAIRSESAGGVGAITVEERILQTETAIANQRGDIRSIEQERALYDGIRGLDVDDVTNPNDDGLATLPPGVVEAATTLRQARSELEGLLEQKEALIVRMEYDSVVTRIPPTSLRPNSFDGNLGRNIRDFFLADSEEGDGLDRLPAASAFGSFTPLGLPLCDGVVVARVDGAVAGEFRALLGQTVAFQTADGRIGRGEVAEVIPVSTQNGYEVRIENPLVDVAVGPPTSLHPTNELDPVQVFATERPHLARESSPNAVVETPTAEDTEIFSLGEAEAKYTIRVPIFENEDDLVPIAQAITTGRGGSDGRRAWAIDGTLNVEVIPNGSNSSGPVNTSGIKPALSKLGSSIGEFSLDDSAGQLNIPITFTPNNDSWSVGVKPQASPGGVGYDFDTGRSTIPDTRAITVSIDVLPSSDGDGKPTIAVRGPAAIVVEPQYVPPSQDP